jgi:hypothetical protein
MQSRRVMNSKETKGKEYVKKMEELQKRLMLLTKILA